MRAAVWHATRDERSVARAALGSGLLLALNLMGRGAFSASIALFSCGYRPVAVRELPAEGCPVDGKAGEEQ